MYIHIDRFKSTRTKSVRSESPPEWSLAVWGTLPQLPSER